MVLAVGIPPLLAARVRPRLCTSGRFVAAGTEPLAGGAGSSGGAIVIADHRVALGDACPPVAVHLRRAPRGTGVLARWTRCGAAGRAVRLRATIDPTCSIMRGTLRASQPPGRTPFVALCSEGCSIPTPFACLTEPGPLIRLSGTHGKPYAGGALPGDARLDVRSATFLASPANRYPLDLAGGNGICLAGGVVQGEYDRSLSWAAMHEINNAGIRFENASTTIDGIRIDDVTDGIRPVAGPFTIRAAWLSYIRDDCIEDDHVQGGVIEDSLLDGCYVAVSERPSPAIERSGFDGRGELLTIRDSLIRLQPMPGPRDGGPVALGHGQFFKWDALATTLALHDNVFLAEQVGEGGPDTMGMPPSLVDCANNVMVWLGEGPYPAPLPRCFTVRRDRTIWDDAVAAWKLRHPEVGKH